MKAPVAVPGLGVHERHIKQGWATVPLKLWPTELTVILHLTMIVAPDESRNQLEEYIKLIEQKILAGTMEAVLGPPHIHTAQRI